MEKSADKILCLPLPLLEKQIEVFIFGIFFSKYFWDFPGGSDGKASVYNAGNPGSIPGSGRSPGEGKWKSTPVLLPGKSHGQKSLVGYSPCGLKESDTTEQLRFTLVDTICFVDELE